MEKGHGIVKVITGVVGDKATSVVDTYLYLNAQDLTDDSTTIDINGHMYPVGYFDESNIELFKLGVTTLDNIRWVYNDYKYANMDKYEEFRKTHTDYFINELMDKYDNSSKISSIVEDFNKLTESSVGVPMFTIDQLDYVKSNSAKSR